MKLTKLFVGTVLWFVTVTSIFGDEAKYNELLSNAKDYESKKQWVYAMGTYWDAILEYPQGANEAYDGFKRIENGFRRYERETEQKGNPGPGDYDIFTRYDGWINVCKEFEIYWNEHSNEIYYVPEISCEKGKADMKSRTISYKFNTFLEFTPKFSTIYECIDKSFYYAHRDDWDEIPYQWPALSMFEDSELIPVVEFISACNDREYDRVPEIPGILNLNPELGTREIDDLSKYTVVGGGKAEFPPYEPKEYYVAAWNNAVAIGDISNHEVRISIFDKNGQIIGSDTSSVFYGYNIEVNRECEYSQFEISGITSDGMKIFDNDEWNYKIESIVTKSKNVTANVEKPIRGKYIRDIEFTDINYTNGPVIKMYRKGNHSDALVEYEAAPFVGDLYSKIKTAKNIQKTLRSPERRNYYRYFNSEDTLEEEVYVITLTGEAKLIKELHMYGELPDKYCVPTYIRFNEKQFNADDILELMKKLYKTEFMLGYIPDTKEACIYCTTLNEDENEKINLAE